MLVLRFIGITAYVAVATSWLICCALAADEDWTTQRIPANYLATLNVSCTLSSTITIVSNNTYLLLSDCSVPVVGLSVTCSNSAVLENTTIVFHNATLSSFSLYCLFGELRNFTLFMDRVDAVTEPNGEAFLEFIASVHGHSTMSHASFFVRNCNISVIQSNFGSSRVLYVHEGVTDSATVVIVNSTIRAVTTLYTVNAGPESSVVAFVGGRSVTNVYVLVNNSTLFISKSLRENVLSDYRSALRVIWFRPDNLIENISVAGWRSQLIVSQENEYTFIGRQSGSVFTCETCGMGCTGPWGNGSVIRNVSFALRQCDVVVNVAELAYVFLIDATDHIRAPTVLMVSESSINVTVQGFLNLSAADVRRSVLARVEWASEETTLTVSHSRVSLNVVSGIELVQPFIASKLFAVEATVLSLLDHQQATVEITSSTVVVVAAGGCFHGPGFVGGQIVFLGRPGKLFGNVSLSMNNVAVHVNVSTTNQLLPTVFFLQGAVFATQASVQLVHVRLDNCLVQVNMPLLSELFNSLASSLFLWASTATALVSISYTQSLASLTGIPAAELAALLTMSGESTPGVGYNITIGSVNGSFVNVTHRFRGQGMRSGVIATARGLLVCGANVGSVTLAFERCHFSNSPMGIPAIVPVAGLPIANDDGSIVTLSLVNMTSSCSISLDATTVALPRVQSMYNVTSSSSRADVDGFTIALRNCNVVCESLGASGTLVKLPTDLAQLAVPCTMFASLSCAPVTPCATVDHRMRVLDAHVVIKNNSITNMRFVFQAFAYPWTSASSVAVGCNAWTSNGGVVTDTIPRSRLNAPRSIVVYTDAVQCPPVSSLTVTPSFDENCTMTVSPLSLLWADIIHGRGWLTVSSRVFASLRKKNETRAEASMFDASVAVVTRVLVTQSSASDQVQILLEAGAAGNLFPSPGFVVVAFRWPGGESTCGAAGLATPPVTLNPPELAFLSQRARDGVSVTVISLGSALSISAGSLSSAVALQRFVLAIQLSECMFDDAAPLQWSDGPTRMAFGPENGQFLRGVVVGNFVLWAAFWLAVVFLAAVRIKRRREPLTAASVQINSRRAGLPGIMVVPLLLLLQPTVACSLALCLSMFDGWRDLMLGVSGMLGALFCVGWLVVRTGLRFGCVAVPTRVRLRRKDGTVWTDIVRWSVTFCSPRVEWTALPDARPFSMECYSAVFEEYDSGRHWFFLVEGGVAVASGVVGGLRPRSDSGCQRTLWVNFAVACGAMLTAWWAPFRSTHGNVNYTVNNLAALSCAILLLCNAEFASNLISVIMVVVTMLSVVSGLAHNALRLYRRWKSFIGRRLLKATEVGGATTFVGFVVGRLLNSRGRPFTLINDGNPELHASLWNAPLDAVAHPTLTNRKTRANGCAAEVRFAGATADPTRWYRESRGFQQFLARVQESCVSCRSPDVALTPEEREYKLHVLVNAICSLPRAPVRAPSRRMSSPTWPKRTSSK